jgi:hypothetical protein
MWNSTAWHSKWGLTYLRLTFEQYNWIIVVLMENRKCEICTMTSEKINLKLRYQQAVVDWDCNWKIWKPEFGVVYHYPIESKNCDIAWRLRVLGLHCLIFTPRQIHQWNKRDTDYCPWCPGRTGTSQHVSRSPMGHSPLELHNGNTSSVTWHVWFSENINPVWIPCTPEYGAPTDVLLISSSRNYVYYL